ncbi:uncharacterized protein LOC132838458 [Tachysurus vachellii]|uniref:uncharacterized protein LOC132838458 n=1 Tax=Tachysurus vachellii TaxID=175792 RepID=UPI00296ADFC1|nr:uncharacterized protein LOC132838458 [Tachysurus vachellii]
MIQTHKHSSLQVLLFSFVSLFLVSEHQDIPLVDDKGPRVSSLLVYNRKDTILQSHGNRRPKDSLIVPPQRIVSLAYRLNLGVLQNLFPVTEWRLTSSCQQTIKQVTCTYLLVGKDGQMDTSTWEKEEVPVPYAECDESLNPEEMEVPFVCCHLSDRRVTDVGLKLPALREAFATLLASIHNQNFLFLVGKKIVMRLAAANIQDVGGVKLAYEALIQFLRTPSYQDSIEAEISSCVPHYNFLDVFFELILFHHFRSGSTLETFKGGFLERLLELVSM